MSSLVLVVALGRWSAATCPPPSRPDVVDFSHRPSNAAHLVLELRLDHDDPEPVALAALAEARQLSLTLLTSVDWAEAHSDWLQGAAERGHEVGLWFDARRDAGGPPGSAARWWQELKRARTALARASGRRPVVIAVEPRTRGAEAALEQMRMAAVLGLDPKDLSAPSRLVGPSGQPSMARVIHEGPYPDGCGAVVEHWEPAAFDRIAFASQGGHVIRAALPSAPPDPELLGRWLDTVALPSGWTVLRARDAADLPLRPASSATTAPKYLRPVDRSTWTAAASEVVDRRALPRLAASLTLTECFLAFVLVLTAETPPETVSLGTLDPPLDMALSTMRGPVPLDPAVVITSARELAPGLTGRVPALVTMGDTTMTAAEALAVYAQVILGQAPVAHPVGDPDPFASGGGWGRSDASAP